MAALTFRYTVICLILNSACINYCLYFIFTFSYIILLLILFPIENLRGRAGGLSWGTVGNRRL